VADQRWETTEFLGSNGAELAVQFLNDADRQGPGEASATLRNDGSAGLMYLTPGSLGTSTSQTWILKQLPGPDGAQAAVQLLNGADRQGPGEASASLRSDGSAGLIFLAPGSLAMSASPAWYFQPEPAPDGAQLAVQFLNDADRQGPGEASVTARGDGTAELIFLGPGSLGTSTAPTWVTTEFTGPNGAQDAVDFLNAWPQQPGPGEAVGWLPGDGSAAVIFYLARPIGIVHP
jgi:hypothetical protein